MKFKFIILLLIVVPLSNVFGKDYIDDQYGISLTLPDEWKVTEYEFLSQKMKRTLERKGQSQTLAVWGIKSSDGLNSETLIIQYQNFEKISFEDAIKTSRSEYGKK